MSESINKISTQTKFEDALLNRQQVPSSDDFHQLEFVDEINGIVYINDAKSIRLTATRNSIEKIETSVVLIIGGKQDADNDYSILSQQLKQKVVAIIYLGNKGEQILKHYHSAFMLYAKADTIQEAVLFATCYAKSGDAILFSPACESKDGNYKIKGNEFKSSVKELKGK
jgi:UDP-N-acetylmuramoylalanine--D-glutamate ligase